VIKSNDIFPTRRREKAPEAFDLTLSLAAGQLDADAIEERLRLAPASE
jgi:hypothetical protein